MLTVNKLDFDTRILNEANTLSAIADVVIITSNYKVKSNEENDFKVIVAKPIIGGTIGLLLNFFNLTKLAFCQEADVFHAHDLHGLCCLFWPALIKKKILVYDSHELWSDVSLFGMYRVFKWPFAWLEVCLMFKVKAIIAVNESIAKILKDKFKKPTLTLYNYPVIDKHIKSSLIRRNNRKKTIIYAGYFTLGRGLEKIIEAAKLLDESYEFLLIGYGGLQKQLNKKIVEYGLVDKVFILEALPIKQLNVFIKKADLGICLIENYSKSYYYSSPNKLFQYIAAEVPILASNFPEYKKIVGKNAIGGLVDPSSSYKIAQKIKFMTKEENQKIYKKNLKGLAVRKFNWDLESEGLKSFYKEIL